MVMLKISVAIHSRFVFGSGSLCATAYTARHTAAMKNLSEAARHGGTSLTTIRIANHVEPQIAHKIANTRYCLTFKSLCARMLEFLHCSGYFNEPLSAADSIWE